MWCFGERSRFFSFSKKFYNKVGVGISFGILIGAASGCDSPQGSDLISGVPIAIPAGPSGSTTGTHSTPEIGASCETGDSEHICLGLKYVVYSDASGNPVIARDSIASNIAAIDVIWNQCNIGFQIDQLVVANPTDYGLNLNPLNYPELDQARSAFSTNDLLLVITTGTWNRSGTLGSTGANAWTNMPGSYVMGVVMEQPVGAYPNIIAHELGHYLNLGHVSNTSDVMNPIIYSNSTTLDTSQCASARAAATYWWTNMIRS
jgi:hypothetical protein